MTQQPSPLSFEENFARLEQILEKMNSGATSLDEALKLYEEADRLVRQCAQRLTQAEQKIEVLIKDRQGDLALDADGKPMTSPFSPGDDR